MFMYLIHNFLLIDNEGAGGLVQHVTVGVAHVHIHLYYILTYSPNFQVSTESHTSPHLMVLELAELLSNNIVRPRSHSKVKVYNTCAKLYSLHAAGLKNN